ncbi:Gfo/Idh/MocA family protein [Paeniglutamicibacter cryotolerans]|uniref:Putative dehydrogenase n=1 Tax=Paeniglutamicibacter cryotolerans TaxID=670079 RepID=A0A839QGJ4_9MICC|nr:Gfo/Idh/MocA family oxidoreductase [Paeniglutamicibacter cryotolerans]MBB2995458.1 putative dehydrogenase [Paeniglutamicibacter cryotolerans]
MRGFPAALPTSRIPDSSSAPAISWGIAGPGWIAERFTESVQAHTHQRITAVGSRSAERAAAFARTYGIATSHGSYAELAADPEVDIVYVATPHPQHFEVAMTAIEAGKHVLVEKPMGITGEQVRLLAEAAAECGVFAAEALWTFFLPKFDVIDQLLEAGVLGEIVSVFAEYGEYFEPGHRIFDPALAGGPLLDLGTYPLAFVNRVLGVPDTVAAIGSPHPSGVNGQLSAVLGFGSGAQGTVNTNLYNFTPTEAVIVGTEATLRIDGLFNMPGGFTLRHSDGRELRYEEPAGAHFEGLHFEAAAVARAITAGLKQAPQRSLADSITTLDLADEIRARTGISFPDTITASRE